MCSTVIYLELHTKLNEDSDIILLFIRVLLQTIRAIVTILRMVKFVQETRRSEILINIHMDNKNEKNNSKKTIELSASIHDWNTTNDKAKNPNNPTYDKSNPNNRNKTKLQKFRNNFSTTDLKPYKSDKDVKKPGMTKGGKNVTSGIFV